MPLNIEDMIKSPITIAVWFMDDGNIRKVKEEVYGYYLNTQSFSLEENLILIQALKKIYGVESMIMKNHEKCRIYIGAKGKEIFSRSIKDLMIASMLYKIG